MPTPPPIDFQESEPLWRSWQAWFLWLTLLAAATQILIYYPQLPERVPSHFGAGGHADAWDTRQGFAASCAAVSGGMTALFLLIVLLLPRLPGGALSIPDRDYWLAPERRACTYARVRREMLLMGAATLLFITTTFHVNIRVALAGADRLPTVFWAALAGFVVFSLAWSVRFMVSFRKPAR